MSTPYVIGTITSGTTSTFIGIDYTEELGRIATALETVANKLTAIEGHQHVIRSLSESSGIHMVGPYDWQTGVDSYTWYVNEGHTLTTSTESTSSLTEFISTVQQIIPNFPKFL